ncbi:42628_t:CDS:1, partial [Gigaspora margarita]
MEAKKIDWKTRFKESVLVPKSVNLEYPTLPTTKNPTEWGKHRQDLIHYVENLHYFGQLFCDIEFMRRLFEKYRQDDDIITDFLESFDLNKEDKKEERYSKRQKKNQRYKNYTNNLLKAFKKIKKENDIKVFFTNARFPISTLYDQDIEPIIDEFLSK